MRSFTLVPVLLGAVLASPAIELSERQATRPVKIDLYLPELLFLNLGSSSVLQQVLSGGGYNNINSKQLTAGGASLSKIFSSNVTPPSTYLRKAEPVINEQSDPNAPRNVSSLFLYAASDGAGVGAGAGGVGAAGGIAPSARGLAAATASGRVPDSEAGGVSTQPFSNLDYSGSFETGYNLSATVGFSTISISRKYQTGPLETVNIGACAAQSAGASAYASFNTTTTIPVNGTSFGSAVVENVAEASCEAGSDNTIKTGGASASKFKRLVFGSKPASPPPSPKIVYGLGSVQAARKEKGGPQAFVNCSGSARSGVQSIKYRLQIQGIFSSNVGFVGNITGIREAVSRAECK